MKIQKAYTADLEVRNPLRIHFLLNTKPYKRKELPKSGQENYYNYSQLLQNKIAKYIQ